MLPTQSLPREEEDFPRGGNPSKHVSLLTCLTSLQPLHSDPKVLFMHVQTEKVLPVVKDFNKKHRVKQNKTAAGLISSHESENQDIHSLKKCISENEYTSKLLSQKMHFRTWVQVITAASKDAFENIGTLQNCFIKKCILKLLPQKYEHK